MKQAERERHLTEENTEKELEEFKGALKVSSITFTFTSRVHFRNPQRSCNKCSARDGELLECKWSIEIQSNKPKIGMQKCISE